MTSISTTPRSYRYATTEDSVARGTRGEAIPFSLFRTLSEPAQHLTLAMLPGSGHRKAHFETPRWIDGLTAQGLDVLTLSYDRQHVHHLHDYARQVFLVLSAAGVMPEAVILAGHSLGGAVAQVLASHDALEEAGFASTTFAGVVLLAALVPELWLRTYIPVLFPLLLRHPRFSKQVQKDPSLLFADAGRARKYLFQPTTPGEVVTWCQSLLCPESGQAASELLRTKTAPLAARRALLISGAHDGIVPPYLVWQSARRYQELGCQAEYLLLPATPHNLMHDGAVERVIEAICQFARSCGSDATLQAA